LLERSKPIPAAARPAEPAAPYPSLMSSLRVGARSVRNRCLMGSMHTRLEHLDRPIERLTAFFAARELAGDGFERRGVEAISGCRCERGLYDEPRVLGAPVELIGGAELAAEIDALRAIDQGTRLALAP